jgi:hypothetical protein
VREGVSLMVREVIGFGIEGVVGAGGVSAGVWAGSLSTWSTRLGVGFGL